MNIEKIVKYKKREASQGKLQMKRQTKTHGMTSEKRETKTGNREKTRKANKKQGICYPKAGKWASTRSAIEINPGVGGENKLENSK